MLARFFEDLAYRFGTPPQPASHPQSFWLKPCNLAVARAPHRRAIASSDMPKALAKAKISMVTPSPQELADARAHLNSMTPQQINAKKASLRQFLAKNPDTGASQGGCPSTILEKFHVHVIRCRDTEKIWSSSRDVQIEKKNSTRR